jgi:hypothetical protein
MLFSRCESRTIIMTITYALNLKISLTKNRQSDALGAVEKYPLGCTEAIMLAHGFTVEMLGRLVLDGLATATPGTVQAGGRPG